MKKNAKSPHLSARLAAEPNTLPKKYEATVTPLLLISEGVAAAKYATLASKYSTAQMPRPSGPAIFRVLTGRLTSLST